MGADCTHTFAHLGALCIGSKEKRAIMAHATPIDSGGALSQPSVGPALPSGEVCPREEGWINLVALQICRVDIRPGEGLTFSLKAC